jgi:hypothetical protein
MEKTMTDATSVNTTAPASSLAMWQEKLNLETASARQFNELVASFNEWTKDQPDEPVKLPDGWHIITPEIALALLIRNASNRKPSLQQVVYFMRQMKDNDWPETGQPVILTPTGRLADAQHRLWASMMGNVPFSTYVVNQRAEIPNVFAYIDNGKVRSAKDALETAGLNGLSPVIATVVSMALHYEADAYKPDSVQRLPKITPLKILHYVTMHPKLREGVRLMAGEYSDAQNLIGHKDVAGFAAYMILSLHDEAVLGEFMGDLGATNESWPEGSPIDALQRVLKADQVAEEPMKKHQILGHIIKAFNAAFVERVPMKRVSLRVNEPWPTFRPKADENAAAETAVAAE